MGVKSYMKESSAGNIRLMDGRPVCLRKAWDKPTSLTRWTAQNLTFEGEEGGAAQGGPFGWVG